MSSLETPAFRTAGKVAEKMHIRSISPTSLPWVPQAVVLTHGLLELRSEYGQPQESPACEAQVSSKSSLDSRSIDIEFSRLCPISSRAFKRTDFATALQYTALYQSAYADEYRSQLFLRLLIPS